jgi:hypothetical protein
MLIRVSPRDVAECRRRGRGKPKDDNCFTANNGVREPVSTEACTYRERVLVSSFIHSQLFLATTRGKQLTKKMKNLSDTNPFQFLASWSWHDYREDLRINPFRFPEKLIPTAKAAYVIHMKNTTFAVLTLYSLTWSYLSSIQASQAQYWKVFYAFDR